MERAGWQQVFSFGIVLFILVASLVSVIATLPSAATSTTVTVTARANSGAPRRTSNTTWTVLVYIALDNNLDDPDPFGLIDGTEMVLTELEAIGSSDRINIVALSDGTDYYGDSKVYYIEDGGRVEIPLSTVNDAWSDGEELDTGDGAVLGAFAEWAMSAYPADHYLLELCSHGGGWYGTCWDYAANYNRITMPEFTAALDTATSAAAQKIDILIFAQCLMAQFEVCAEIRPYVDYVIGSEEMVMPIPGYQETGLQALNDSLHLAPAAMADQIALDLMNFYRSSSATLALSVIDCAATPALTAAVDAFAIEAMDSIYYDEIADARNQTQEYGDDHEYYDLYQFVDEIASAIPPGELKSACGAVRRAINTTIRYSDHTNGVVGYEYSVDVANGLSIDLSENGAPASGYRNLQTSRNTHWDEFLDNYCDPRPVAEAGPDQTVVAGETVVLNGSASLDPDGTLVEWRWDFDATDGLAVDATGPYAQTSYAMPGDYTVTLTIENAEGESDTDTLIVTLLTLNRPPTILATAPEQMEMIEDGQTLLELASVFVDPDGDPLAYNITVSATPALVTYQLWPNGTLQLDGLPDRNGEALLSVIASDSQNAPVQWCVNITVIPVDDPPQLELADGTNWTLWEGEPFNYTVEATDIDAAPGELRFSADTDLFPIDPLSGTIAFTPTNEMVGNYTVTFTVTDGEGATDQCTIAIHILNTNDSPEALTIVSPADGDEYASNTTIVFEATASDPDGDPLVYYWSSNLTGGIGTGGRCEAQLSPGNHTITVRAVDPAGASVSQSLSISIQHPGDPDDGNTTDPGDGTDNGTSDTDPPVDDTIINGTDPEYDPDPDHPGNDSNDTSISLPDPDDDPLTNDSDHATDIDTDTDPIDDGNREDGGAGSHWQPPTANADDETDDRPSEPSSKSLLDPWPIRLLIIGGIATVVALVVMIVITRQRYP